MGKKHGSVDEYIAEFPVGTQLVIKQLRMLLLKCAPQAEELISYNMPALKLNGMLVYYAAYNSHIGFYPGAETIKVFRTDLKAFKSSKGAVQFPLNRPLPVILIRKMTAFKRDYNKRNMEMKLKMKVKT